jgi:hypothetical protein
MTSQYNTLWSSLLFSTLMLLSCDARNSNLIFENAVGLNNKETQHYNPSHKASKVTPNTEEQAGQHELIDDTDKELAHISSISSEGHQISFFQERNGQWQAEVREEPVSGFSRSTILPVVCTDGYEVENLCNYDKVWQKQRVQVVSDKALPRGGVVHIGKRGLRGGGRRERLNYFLNNQYEHEVTARTVESSGNDFVGETLFRRLPPAHLPFMLPPQQIYVSTPAGIHTIRSTIADPGSLIRMYGVSSTMHPNYVQIWRDNVGYSYHESFAHAVGGGPERNYPIKYQTRSGYDRGHGIDLEDTIVQPHNSNDDPANYIPQGPNYNTKLRNQLVQMMRRQRNGQYREVALYDESAPYTIPQKRIGCGRGNPQPWRAVEVPRSFLFHRTGALDALYYFPNDLTFKVKVTGQGESFDEIARYRLRLRSQEREALSLDHLTLPIVFDRRCPRAHIPIQYTNMYHAARLLGWTPWDMNRETMIFTGWSDSEGFDLSPDLSKIIYSELGIQKPISDYHKDLLNRFLARKLLCDAAKYEYDSTVIRLSTAKMLCKCLGDETNAKYFIDQALTYAGSSVSDLRQAVRSVNYVLDSELGSLFSRDEVLNVVNTHLRNNTYHSATECDVATLVQASKVRSLPEYSLAGHSFWLDEDQWRKELTTPWLDEDQGREEHIALSTSSSLGYHYDNNHHIEAILENLENLEKGSGSTLRKLDLSGLRYNGSYLHTEGLFTPNLIRWLYHRRFPNLEILDLSFNGIRGNLIWSPRELLDNFPSLKELDLSSNRLPDSTISKLKSDCQARGIEVYLDGQEEEDDDECTSNYGQEEEDNHSEDADSDDEEGSSLRDSDDDSDD